MAKERRQFISLTDEEADSFNGLPNEITVSPEHGTLRVHTAANPHGNLLAKQADLANTENRVTNLEGRTTSGFNYSFSYICNEANTDSDTGTLYPYKATIQLQHLTPDNHDTLAYVMLDASDVVSGNFAPFANYDSATGNLTIYSKEEGQATHTGSVALVDIRRADTND